jgi:hypothetical protein
MVISIEKKFSKSSDLISINEVDRASASASTGQI